MPGLGVSASVAPTPVSGSPTLRRASVSNRRASLVKTSSSKGTLRLLHRSRAGSSEFLLTEVRNAFDPNSRFIRVWLQLRLAGILVELLIIPFLATFRVDATRTHLAGVYVCELLFCVDIYVQLNTGYYENGNVLRDARKARRKYLSSPGFVLDVLALLPFSLVLPTSITTGRSLALLELHKLSRVWRMPALVSNLDDLYARHFAPLKLGKVLGLTLLLSHFVACARFGFGYFVYTSPDAQRDVWLPLAPATGDVEAHSPRRRYLMSLFWAFGLLTGQYEGDLPHTAAEFAFTIAVALCGFALFTSLCATFFLLSKCERGDAETAEARVHQFRHLLAFHRVPAQLQAQAVDYLQRYYTQAEANDREAARRLCPSISADVQVELLEETVAQVPVFAGCDRLFVRAVARLLELLALPARFALFRTGDHGDAMYIVHAGVLHTVVGGVKVRELRKGSFVGEVAVFARLPRTATVVTATYCTLYRLSRFHADKLLEGYPRFAQQIKRTIADMLHRSKNAEAEAAAADDGESVKSASVNTIGAATKSSKKPVLSLLQVFRLKRMARKLSRKNSNQQVQDFKELSDASTREDNSRPLEAEAATPTPCLQPRPHLQPAHLPPLGIGVGRVAPVAAFAPRRPSPLLQIRHHSDGREASRRSSGALKRVMSLKVFPMPSSSRRGSGHAQADSPSAPGEEDTTITRRGSGRRSSKLLAGLHRISHLRESFFRNDSTEKPSDAIQGFYQQFSHLSAPPPPRWHWWWRLLMRRGLDADSNARMGWILALTVVCCYNWLVVPLQLSFEGLTSLNMRWYVGAVNLLADVLLWTDIYGNLHLSFSINSEKILEPARTAERYMRSGRFVLDLCCAWPYWVFLPGRWALPVLRLPRLFIAYRLPGLFAEVEAFFRLGSRQRLLLLGLLLVMLYHIVACLYFNITDFDGFSTGVDTWLPANDVLLRRVNATHVADISGAIYPDDSDAVYEIRKKQYFRSLYYAANVLAAVGRTLEPQSDTQYGAALLFMLSGFLITAIVVDNVQKRFTASALEQKEFFAARAHIQRFLKRQNTPLAIHQRVNSFLDFWWSAHRGAIIDELLHELPATIKRDIVRSICTPAMDSLDLLCSAAAPTAAAAATTHLHKQGTDASGDATEPTVLELMEDLFLDNLKFVLYGQGEIIYRRGDYAAGLFFLLEGQVAILMDSEPPRHVPLGGFFGTAALQPAPHDAPESSAEGAAVPTASVGYAERVTAVSGCIVVYVSREHLRAMQGIFPQLAEGLRDLEKRFHETRVARSSDLRSMQPRQGVSRLGLKNPPTLRRALRNKQRSRLVERLVKNVEWWQRGTSVDPDSPFVGNWETGMFLASTLQSTLVVFYTCFGVGPGADARVAADALMVTIELAFLVDVYLQSRLGFYEYGNKIMDLTAIRRRYFRSWHFAIDVGALVPFFVLNWALPSQYVRLEILNANKLLRLFKTSSEFRALETKYVKRTMELRLLKLVYATFLASHIFGCIWFDFGAHNSGLHATTSNSEGSEWAPGFGETRWVPSKALGDSARSVQYLASLFWSFGLMSNSTPGELPKTVAQCLFSVLTMTVGFFLFAYVVGNFSDVIELQDSENRHFVAKLSSLRQLLRHFELPASVEEKFKKYFFFKRFHSITQEHILERVLPPSLLVDIRMFQLQPMIVKVAFLVGMEDSVTRMLVSLFTQVLFVKDEFICRFGEEGSEMFFIFTGVLDIYIPLLAPTAAATPAAVSAASNANGALPAFYPSSAAGTRVSFSGLRKVNEITAGSYFGEAALFTNTPRNAYVKANTSCILYKLSRHSLELVFERYPEWKLKVLRIVKIQQQQQRLHRLAYEAQAPESGTGGRRGAKRVMSRIDAVNSRAENIEQLLLAHRRATRVTRSTSHAMRSWWRSLQWKNARLQTFITQWVLPVLRVARQLVYGAEIQSPLYLLWLRLVSFCTVFVAVLVPYRLVYDSLDRWNALPVALRVLEALCELVFWLDIWFQFHMRTNQQAMELYEQDQLLAYKRERLALDMAAAFPLDYFASGFIASLYGLDRSLMRKWLRLNRCLKVTNLMYYRNEITRRSVSYEINRAQTLWLLYLLAMFWTSCAYFAVAMHDGFGTQWQAWLPSVILATPEHTSPDLLLLRLFRGFSFATTAFVKKGKTFVPTSSLTYAFSILVSFGGQLIMALMIGEMANVFLLYIDNQVQFRKSHLTVELFLARWKVSPVLKRRADAFLTSWWSSHAGVDYQLIFDDLPASVRTEGVSAIAQVPLTRFVNCNFRPLLLDGLFSTDACEDERGGGGERAEAARAQRYVDLHVGNLTYAIAQCLRFEGYPRDEDVIVEGSVCKAMYFVVRGYLLSKSESNPELYHAGRFRSGDYFGESGLLGHSVSVFTVTTIRACDLFVASSEQLLQVLQQHAFFRLVLAAARSAVRQKLTATEFVAKCNDNSDDSDDDNSGEDDSDAEDDREYWRVSTGSSMPPLRRDGNEDKAKSRDDVRQLKKLLRGAPKETLSAWETTFALFLEMVVSRGTMNTLDESASLDGEVAHVAGLP